MRTNRMSARAETHAGGSAPINNSAESNLRRAVMSTLLWEKQFYEDGEEIATRIADLIPMVSPVVCADIAFEARDKMKLRHIPLFIAREMLRHPRHRLLVSFVLSVVIQRPDELAEFLALYWKEGRRPIPAQVKKGLARAFTKFTEYQLAKYNRDHAVRLRDVLFLCHAKPKDEQQAMIWKRLVSNELAIPDTWEVALSAGGNKKEAWERLLAEKRLGGLAFLRNLRNMQNADISSAAIRMGFLTANFDKTLPFRFIAAAKHAPDFEPELQAAMTSCLEKMEKMKGRTCLLIDVSGSMDNAISAKSDLTRLDAACALAILLREICPEVDIYTFSEHLAKIPPRNGFALRDSILRSQLHSGTYLGRALATIASLPEKFDRMVVITDEQSADSIPAATWKKSYMLNVASNKNGIAHGAWNRIDGWSESIISYMQALESTQEAK